MLSSITQTDKKQLLELLIILVKIIAQCNIITMEHTHIPFTSLKEHVIKKNLWWNYELDYQINEMLEYVIKTLTVKL